MKLYIWEGAGISSGYHNDGTLIVLAESPEQARELVLAKKAEWDADQQWDSIDDWWDLDSAIANMDREPDRILEPDSPSVVSFNGGGYD